LISCTCQRYERELVPCTHIARTIYYLRVELPAIEANPETKALHEATDGDPTKEANYLALRKQYFAGQRD
jgi:hypothetical protein